MDSLNRAEALKEMALLEGREAKARLVFMATKGTCQGDAISAILDRLKEDRCVCPYEARHLDAEIIEDVVAVFKMELYRLFHSDHTDVVG